MNSYSKGIRIIIGLIFAICVVMVAMAFQSKDAKTTTNPSLTKAPNYPANENGQTYGSAGDAISSESEPDLISAVGVDGAMGYVLKKDIEGEQPKTPEEALAIQNSRPLGGSDIPLYDIDGKTVIGVFHIGGNS
ncbi:hypothetical protein BK133_08145 [Paenibacillus sp. FSL H8-0548]|uniref:hypothetical protein n=1 Tax=Paenibacillus sp. FSL H8-0548 TaxID=1920422 RepID=UPI00096C82D1|nr:hypothetical protein [Paenibacillus sp. FSL H8-0548]OMF36881.1 hypothetical protein BK133_08145 [Paenibacillus sp. FSL H8-0548]